LPVPSFCNTDFYPRVRHAFAITNRGISLPQPGGLSDDSGEAGRRTSILEFDPGFYFIQLRCCDHTLNLRPIGLYKSVARLTNLRLELAVVGQQEEPFAIVIEPAGRVDILVRDELGQGASTIVVAELTEYLVRLIEQD